MNKEERIAKYGEAAYAKLSAWQKAHPEEKAAQNRAWCEAHPEEVAAAANEKNRKGGKYYDMNLQYNRTGIQGEKTRIRSKHGIFWRPFKNIIAPDSQIHHEWIPGTADFTGLALVEANQHMHGVVDVIEILDGKITLLTEEEIRKGGGW